MKNNMIWVIGLVVLIVVIILFGQYFSKLIGFQDRVVLSEDYKTYKYLSDESNIASKIEVLKILDNWLGAAEIDGKISLKGIWYDLKTETYVLITHLTYYINDYEEQGYYEENEYPILYKVNSDGKIFDSLKLVEQHSLDNLHDSGVIFNDDHFIDWVNTGDTKKKRYKSIVDGDALSKEELINILKNSDIVNVGYTLGMDGEGIIRFYIYFSGNWSVLKSTQLYNSKEAWEWEEQKISLNSIKLLPYLDSYEKRFLRLKSITQNESIQKPYRWTDPSNPLYLQYFQRTKKRKINSFNPYGSKRPGWEGIGYFRLKLNPDNDDILHFKSYAFKDQDKTWGYTPYISVLSHSNKRDMLTFVYINKFGNNEMLYSNSGIYVLLTKK